MNLLELQQRANVLVEKANAYEDSLQGVTWNEQEIINQHKYTDIYSLRPIMKLLFGSTISEKTNRTLDNDVTLRVFASTAPMWNSSFNLLSFNKEMPPITDLNSYLFYYGYYPDSPVVTCNPSASTLTIPQGLHIQTPYGEYTNTNSLTQTRKGDTGSHPNVDLLYMYTYDLSTNKQVTYRCPRAVFSNSIPTSEYEGEQYFWFNTTNKSWYRCKDGAINLDLSTRYATLVALTHYDQSNPSISGNLTSIETDQFKISPESIIPQDVDYKSDRHEFMNDIHNYNNSNLITLDVKQNTLTDRESRIKQGINYSYSANIQDALVTESQVANVFKWNTTTPQDIKNNTITVSRQVPGIVCYYLGNDYNGEYTATIPYNPGTMKLNQINYSTPPSYGAFYTTDPTTSQVPVRQGVLEEDIGHEACRIFIPGMHFTRGKLESPQQIWQPDMKFGDSNIGLGYNWQGQALYHELVFKNRRSGSKKANVDFVSTLDTVADNDPQGLATRFALAQQKKYYKNRPWFNELDELVDLDPTRLQKIIENNSYITTSGGSFDKSKFTVATGGELDDNGILNDCSKKVTVTGLNIPLTNELIIFGPKITFEFNSNDASSPNDQIYIRDTGTNFTSVSEGLSSEWVSTYLPFNPAGQSVSLLDQKLTNGTYQLKINLKKVSDQIQVLYQFINTSNDSIIYQTTRTGTPKGDFTIKDMIIANDSLQQNETSKVYNLSSIKIVDQDDTVLFSAQSEASKTYMTDEQFYNQFKLDYDMFARAFNLPQ